MMSDLTHQFHIDATLFGQFSGIYYIGYTLLHLPIGMLLDRFGPRKIMTVCILLAVLGLIPILFSDNWIALLLGRALIGIGSSAAILGIFKIIRMSFKAKHFARMLSFSVTIGLIGAIYGEGPVSLMNHAWGYQAVVAFFAIVGLVLAFVTYFVVPEVEPDEHPSILASIKTVLTNSKVMMLCCFAGLMVGPLEGFADIWGPQFLKQVYGLNASIASYLPSMIFMGMCFGAPVLSLAAEKTKQYLGVVIAAGTIMCIIFTALIAGILSLSSITIGFIIIGICCAYQILAIYKASTYVPENLAGLTTAVANMIIMSFGYFFHSVIGAVVTAYGGTQVTQAFVYGVSVIPIALAVGVIGISCLALQGE